jgi:hypothetical protein
MQNEVYDDPADLPAAGNTLKKRRNLGHVGRHVLVNCVQYLFVLSPLRKQLHLHKKSSYKLKLSTQTNNQICYSRIPFLYLLNELQICINI